MSAKSSNNQSDVHKIYVVAGKDSFLANRECEKIVDSILSEDQKQLSLLNIDADKAVIADVLDELRTLPFLSDRRVAVIRNADDFISENRQLLEKYFDNPSSTGVLVLTVSTWQKTTKLAKKLDSIGKLVAIDDFKKGGFVNFIIDYAAKEHNRKITIATARMLNELVGDDAGRLSSEIDKLVSFDPKSAAISESAVAQIVGNNRFFDAFNIIDAMSGGRVEEAVEKFRRMLAADKSAEFTTIGAFAYHFRRMFTAKALMQKKTPINNIISQCKIWYNKEGFFASLEKLSLAQLSKILSELATIDYGVKTGRAKISSELETLIVKVGLINHSKRQRA